MKPVVEFENVSKAYRLGERRGGVRDALAGAGRNLFAARSRPESDLMWALRGVSFRIGEGEAVGFVGPNGAGKTTIMKVLSRITRATEGAVRSRGRMSSLIELGAGFHPDLTGRENIFLNGTILGMTRAEIRRRMDEIVAFSGLEDFLATPVKRYSSGMYARLAFSVAAHTGASILLVDEVLAVGDLGFQAKSAQRMADLVSQGVTVLFISHSLYYVSSFCNRAVLLNRGRIECEGATREVVAGYQTLMRARADADRADASASSEQSSGDQPRFSEAQLLDESGNPADRFETGSSMRLRIRGFAPQPVSNAVLRVSIFSSEGVRCITADTRHDGVDLGQLEGEFEVDLDFPEMTLLPDSYSITAWLLEERGVGAYDWRESWTTFLVGHPTHDASEGGIVYLPRTWTARNARSVVS